MAADRRTSGLNGLLAIVSTAIVLVVLEVALRIADVRTDFDFFHVMRSKQSSDTAAPGMLRLLDLIRLSDDPGIVYELEPGVQGTFIGVPVKINSDGQRGPRVDRPKHEGALRLVVLGDSIAFGWGVEETDTFTHRLVERFTTDHPNGPRLEAVNLGVPGYNAHQEVAALEAKGLPYAPDLVVILFCPNDDELPNFIHRASRPWTLSRSYLRDWISIRLKLLTRQGRMRNTHPPKGLYGGPGPRRIPPELQHMVGGEAVKAAYRRLGEIATARHFTVVYSAYGEHPRLDPELRPLAESLGFRVVDLPALVRQHLAAQQLSFASFVLGPRDRHPNVAYHQLIADALYEHAVVPWWNDRRGQSSETGGDS